MITRELIKREHKLRAKKGYTEYFLGNEFIDYEDSVVRWDVRDILYAFGELDDDTFKKLSEGVQCGKVKIYLDTEHTYGLGICYRFDDSIFENFKKYTNSYLDAEAFIKYIRYKIEISDDYKLNERVKETIYKFNGWWNRPKNEDNISINEYYKKLIEPYIEFMNRIEKAKDGIAKLVELYEKELSILLKKYNEKYNKKFKCPSGHVENNIEKDVMGLEKEFFGEE